MTTPPNPKQEAKGMWAEAIVEKFMDHYRIGKKHKHCALTELIRLIECLEAKSFRKGFEACQEKAAKEAESLNEAVVAWHIRKFQPPEAE